MIRDRDRIYGTVVTRRLLAMGIRDKPIAPASPWQNGFAERLIGSIRRECLDHVIVSSEAHLRRILKSYADYLQLRQNASVFAQGCADFSSDSSDRKRSFTPGPWWTSSPLLPNLGFRYTQRLVRAAADRLSAEFGYVSEPEPRVKAAVKFLPSFRDGT